jgi:hypothetical protein
MEALSPADAATVEKVLSDVINRLESADGQ